MTRIMRDSITARDIRSHGLDLAAGYANGTFRWHNSDWALFPGIPHVHIDVNGTDPGGSGVLDVENGDATPATAVNWVKARKAALPGAYAVVYCDRSTLTPLFNAMAGAKLHVVADFHLWISTLDGTKSVPDMTGVVAVQWAGQNITGAHYDESLVYDDSWHPTD